MGLDSVELVIACEDAFGVRITDAEAERVITPEDLVQLMIEKVRPSREGPCATHRAFNQIRTALATAFGVERCWVGTGTPVDHVLPKGPSWEVVRELEWRAGHAEWPHLYRESLFGPVSAVPGRVRTVGDLARWMVLHGPIAERSSDGEPPKEWTRSGVRTTVRHLVARQLGLDDFNDEDELVRDLGVD